MRGGDVAADLFFQIVETIETLLGPEEIQKRDFDVRVVKVALEIQQVQFEAEFGFRFVDGGPDSDIHDALQGRAAHLGKHGINAVRWSDEPLNIDVRGRETEFPANLISANNRSADGVSSAEHLAGGFQFSLGNALADACAADDLSSKTHRSHTVRVKPK